MQNPTPTTEDYKSLAKESRLKVLDLVYRAQTSHIGSLMGAADIFAVLFSKINLDKDKFVLSAGWKAALLYFHLWKKGRITLEELDSYCQEVDETCSICFGEPHAVSGKKCWKCGVKGTIKVPSKFIGLAEPIHPDIPFAGGSMGYGLPAAVGFALAKKLKGEAGTIYCYMSDGEIAIGTTWESALIAAHHKLDNLVVIVESNGFQAMGRTDEILEIDHLWVKWSDFGWQAEECDGHTLEDVHGSVANAMDRRQVAAFPNRPKVILAETIKGRGVSFMENNNLYHYKALSEEEYIKAKQELA